MPHAILIVKYRTPTAKSLRYWQSIFPALQISLAEDGTFQQELSLHSEEALEPTQVLYEVWKVVPVEVLESAEVLVGSDRMRLRGGDPIRQIELNPKS